MDNARLRHAARLAVAASPPTRALLQSDGGKEWTEELAVALDIMRRMLTPRLDELPLLHGVAAPEQAVAQWTFFMRSWPRQWKSLLKLLRAAIAERPDEYTQLATAFRGAGADVSSDSDGEWLCVQCSVTFATHRALKLHRIHAHSLRRPVRKYCIGSTCPTCKVDWHSRVRCLWHMERGTLACRQAWMSGALPEFPPEQVEVADQAVRQFRTEQHRLGRSQFAGPPPVRLGAG